MFYLKNFLSKVGTRKTYLESKKALNKTKMRISQNTTNFLSVKKYSHFLSLLFCFSSRDFFPYASTRCTNFSAYRFVCWLSWLGTSKQRSTLHCYSFNHRFIIFNIRFQQKKNCLNKFTLKILSAVSSWTFLFSCFFFAFDFKFTAFHRFFIIGGRFLVRLWECLR